MVAAGFLMRKIVLSEWKIQQSTISTGPRVVQTD